MDDSPFEIETVNVVLPEISTILFKRNMEYDQFSCFNLKTSISVTEVKKRVKTYQTNRLREELKINYRDHNDYIENLKINVDIHEALPIEYSRIAELTQRTSVRTEGGTRSQRLRNVFLLVLLNCIRFLCQTGFVIWDW